MNFVIHWNEKALGSHVFPIPILPGESHGQKRLAGSPWGGKESDTAERLSAAQPRKEQREHAGQLHEAKGCFVGGPILELCWLYYPLSWQTFPLQIRTSTSYNSSGILFPKYILDFSASFYLHHLSFGLKVCPHFHSCFAMIHFSQATQIFFLGCHSFV